MTKFKEIVDASEKTLPEYAREYSEQFGVSLQTARTSGKRFYRCGVKTLSQGALNWCSLLDCSFKEIRENPCKTEENGV